MLELTRKGIAVLEALEGLSEKDIRLLGLIHFEDIVIEKTIRGIEYFGYRKEQVQNLQVLGYIKKGGE